MTSSALSHIHRRFQIRRFGIIAAAVMLLAVATTAAMADTIKLKNGSIIKGRVVGYSQGEFTVILDLGTSSRRSSTRMIIAAEDIESIEFDGADGQSSISQAVTPRDTAPSKPPASSTSTPSRPQDIAITPPIEKPATPPRRNEPEATPSSPGSSAPAGPVVAEKEVRVVASVDWTNTNLRIQKGQRITISASGEVDLGRGRRSGPAGIELTDPGKLLEDRLTGALIAVIGDDNNDFIFVGRQAEFTAAHSGFLYLSVNERDLKDNSGSYIAKVKISGSN
ncbi:MAG: hypothetical protein KF868_16175 [Acidobacteria bacterium]|nr:hypothetical protein [Acidobacteriota bacterium]